MPWADDQPHAGFSQIEPWLPIPQAHRALAVNLQEDDSTALLHSVRTQIAFRNQHPALVHGALRPVATDRPCIAFLREHPDETVFCAFNTSDASIALTIPADCPGAGETVMLEPYGSLFRDQGTPPITASYDAMALQHDG